MESRTRSSRRLRLGGERPSLHADHHHRTFSHQHPITHIILPCSSHICYPDTVIIWRVLIDAVYNWPEQRKSCENAGPALSRSTHTIRWLTTTTPFSEPRISSRQWLHLKTSSTLVLAFGGVADFAIRFVLSGVRQRRRRIGALLQDSRFTMAGRAKFVADH